MVSPREARGDNALDGFGRQAAVFYNSGVGRCCGLPHEHRLFRPGRPVEIVYSMASPPEVRGDKRNRLFCSERRAEIVYSMVSLREARGDSVFDGFGPGSQRRWCNRWAFDECLSFWRSGGPVGPPRGPGGGI